MTTRKFLNNKEEVLHIIQTVRGCGYNLYFLKNLPFAAVFITNIQNDMWMWSIKTKNLSYPKIGPGKKRVVSTGVETIEDALEIIQNTLDPLNGTFDIEV
jgi:hypothetical protein